MRDTGKSEKGFPEVNASRETRFAVGVHADG